MITWNIAYEAYNNEMKLIGKYSNRGSWKIGEETPTIYLPEIMKVISAYVEVNKEEMNFVSKILPVSPNLSQIIFREDMAVFLIENLWLKQKTT